MKDLSGKVAVITGGASGIGCGIATAFAEAGMRVVVADIEHEKAEEVARRIRATGARALAVSTDVTELRSVTRLADRCYDAFGAVHVLCNNAGVLLMGPLSEMIAEDWSWTFDVNVLGVAHGLQTFLPRMRAQGDACHVVNTASVTGLFEAPGMLIYGATKATVLSISQSLRSELGGSPIGVSVLLPSDIRSAIVGSQRNRPAQFGRHHRQSVDPELASRHGLDPVDVGRRVREGIERDEFYLFSLPLQLVERMSEQLRSTAAEILEALAKGAMPGDVDPGPSP